MLVGNPVTKNCKIAFFFVRTAIYENIINSPYVFFVHLKMILKGESLKKEEKLSKMLQIFQKKKFEASKIRNISFVALQFYVISY